MIEPCPFCGGVEIEAGMDAFNRTFMRCSGCGTRGPFGKMMEGPFGSETYREAVQKWNQRAVPMPGEKGKE